MSMSVAPVRRGHLLQTLQELEVSFVELSLVMAIIANIMTEAAIIKPIYGGLVPEKRAATSPT